MRIILGIFLLNFYYITTNFAFSLSLPESNLFPKPKAHPLNKNEQSWEKIDDILKKGIKIDGQKYKVFLSDELKNILPNNRDLENKLFQKFKELLPPNPKAVSIKFFLYQDTIAYSFLLGKNAK